MRSLPSPASRKSENSQRSQKTAAHHGQRIRLCVALLDHRLRPNHFRADQPNVRLVLLLLLVAAAVVALVLTSAWRTRGLSAVLRIGTGLVPPVALVGAAFIYLVLGLCGEADSGTVTPDLAGTCRRSISLSEPLALGYLGLIVGTWIAGLIVGGRHQRSRWLLRCCITITVVAPPTVLAARIMVVAL